MAIEKARNINSSDEIINNSDQLQIVKNQSSATNLDLVNSSVEVVNTGTNKSKQVRDYVIVTDVRAKESPDLLEVKSSEKPD